MNWLRRLPDSRREAAGLEWRLWKRLPALLAWGTVLPGLAAALMAWAPWSATSTAMAEDPQRLLWIYAAVGLITLHWSLVLAVAIGCIIVMLMKGPAYVADAYPLQERDEDTPPRA